MPWLTALLCLAPPLAPAPAAYGLYDGQGRPVAYADMIAAMAAAEVVFFGELHNDAVAHWLEREVAAALFGRVGARLQLGAEMLERDQQLILDEYLSGAIRPQDFTAGTRLWPNWATDYAPLAEFARTNKLRFTATNVPRRYAAMVSRGGWPALDKLLPEARGYLAPLPVTVDASLPSYKAMLGMDTHGGVKPENLVAAQALKDATMADSIHRALAPGGLMLHFNGAYHSNGREGTVWYLARLRPTAKVVTLATVQAADPTKVPAEALKTADYLLVTPESMTKTQAETGG